MTTNERRAAGVALALLVAAAGCGGGGHDAHDHETGEHADEHAEHGAGEDDHHDDEDGVVELTPEAIARIGLAWTAATPHRLAVRRQTTGRIGYDEDRLAHVGPRVGGRLVRVDGELGERVSAGETLAVLDSLDLGSAKAAFLRARARHEVAAQRARRQRALHADQVASEEAALDAEAIAREEAADLAAAREALRLLGKSEAEIDRLEWGDAGASRVAVAAPFAGEIVAREATLGELVGPDDTLFTVADLGRVWLWVDLYERDLAHVAVGQGVEVRLDAWPEHSFAGELAYLGAELDPHSQTVRARVDLANPERRLKPGMFARVTLASGEAAAPVLAVPRSAVQRDGAAAIVFVRTAPGTFARREVEIGVTTDDFVEVLAGLEEGDEVVTEGAFLLRSQASADELGGGHHH